MSDIPPEVVDRMMVKCGRRCCICKRFRSTKLQVHHILEREHGGTNDEDNLIVTCLPCHSDVHTKTPFARRFSREELKLHRETLVKQVEEGIFGDADTDDTDEVIRRVLHELRGISRTAPQLTQRAVEILLRASAEGEGQGTIAHVDTFEGFALEVAGDNIVTSPKDARLVAAYKHGLQQLAAHGLIEPLDCTVTEVTYDGYLLADELKTAGAKALTE